MHRPLRKRAPRRRGYASVLSHARCSVADLPCEPDQPPPHQPPPDQPPPRRAKAPSDLASASVRSADPRRALGRLGESIAVARLRRLGFAPVARNVRTRGGEIDLIACDGSTLLFIEVKCRRARAGKRAREREPEPLAGLRWRQRARIRKLAAAWLRDPDRPHVRADAIRFDAIGVIVDADDALVRLQHIEAAW
jgi:putative endonuclease